MWINIIDYRGDDTVINSRGDSLFQYRTHYFRKQQEDFYRWQQQGHKFRCWTQHKDDNHGEFDDVIRTSRKTAAQARNEILNHYSKDTWIGIWDNDSTLYWDKLSSNLLPQELQQLCNQADCENIIGLIPFNSQQSPYPKIVPERWTLKPKLEQKGSMLFVKVTEHRYDNDMMALGDCEYAYRLSQLGYKFSMIEQASLNEYQSDKSTIFQVNAYHQQYKKPGPNANPKGLLKWDGGYDRKEKYQQWTNYIENKLGKTIKQLREEHKLLWKQKNNQFEELFQEIN